MDRARLGGAGGGVCEAAPMAAGAKAGREAPRRGPPVPPDRGRIHARGSASIGRARELRTGLRAGRRVAPAEQ